MHYEVAYRIYSIPDGRVDSKYLQTASKHLTECERIHQTLGSTSRSRKRAAKLLLKVNDRKNLESARRPRPT